MRNFYHAVHLLFLTGIRFLGDTFINTIAYTTCAAADVYEYIFLKKVADLCNSHNISTSCLISWVKPYQEHADLILTVCAWMAL